MRCTIGSDMARLRAPAPLVGRAAGGETLGVNCDPPLTILNFNGFPVALRSASCTMRLGPSPRATSTMTCDMATFTETSMPRTVHSPDSKLCASICWPASSSAPKTALRAMSGVTSTAASAGGSSIATATATDAGDSALTVAGEVSTALALDPLVGVLVIAGASALGSFLRLRSASNGDGPLNGEDATPREDGASGADGRVTGGRLRVPLGLAFPDNALPPREGVAATLAASPLSNCSSGSRRWAWTSFNKPSSKWKRCSCLYPTSEWVRSMIRSEE